MFALVVWCSLAAAGPMLALSFAVEGPARIAASLAFLRWETVAAIAYLVYMSTLLGFAVWNWLLSRYPAASVAPLTLMVPLFGMTSSSLVLGEEMQPWKLIAFALVILGLCINLFGARLVVCLVGARQ
jgi:O-acetylserine/cysteine efflux transporter